MSSGLRPARIYGRLDNLALSRALRGVTTKTGACGYLIGGDGHGCAFQVNALRSTERSVARRTDRPALGLAKQVLGGHGTHRAGSEPLAARRSMRRWGRFGRCRAAEATARSGRARRTRAPEACWSPASKRPLALRGTCRRTGTRRGNREGSASDNRRTEHRHDAATAIRIKGSAISPFHVDGRQLSPSHLQTRPRAPASPTTPHCSKGLQRLGHPQRHLALRASTVRIKPTAKVAPLHGEHCASCRPKRCHLSVSRETRPPLLRRRPTAPERTRITKDHFAARTACPAPRRPGNYGYLKAPPFERST